MKPAFREATAGHENQMYRMAKTMLSLPDTSVEDYVAAEQAAERLRDGYAAFFRDFDVLLTRCYQCRHTSTASANSSSTARRST